MYKTTGFEIQTGDMLTGPLPPKGSSHVNLWELQPHSQGLSQGTSRRELWK